MSSPDPAIKSEPATELATALSELKNFLKVMSLNAALPSSSSSSLPLP